MAEGGARGLAPVSALDGMALGGEEGIATVVEAAAVGRIALRAGRDAAAAIAAATGLPLALGINRAAEGETAAVLELGPDEWLLLCDMERDAWLASRIVEAAAGAAAVTDVTDARASIEIAGPHVEAVLAAGCPLPLDLRGFPVGRATRTLLGKAEVVLWRRAEDRFRIEVARSFAPYVCDLLAAAIACEAAITGLAKAPG